jgi:hypothetical protein
MLRPQLRQTGPFFLVSRHQSLIAVFNGFIRQLHCNLNLSIDSIRGCSMKIGVQRAVQVKAIWENRVLQLILKSKG